MKIARLCLAVMALVLVATFPVMAKSPEGQTLGLKASDFQTRFNDAAVRVNASIRADNVEIKQAEAGMILKTAFSPSVRLWGTMDQSGNELNKMSMLFAGGDKNEASRFIVCAVILVEMCSPGLEQKGCLALLKDMGFFDPDHQKGECTRDGVRYTFSKESGVGIMFVVAAI
ncbi:MAG: hypothetical protein AB7E47_02910 [Desulfovibrionaceae bacterium]